MDHNSIIFEIKYDIKIDALAYLKQYASFASNIDIILKRFLTKEIFDALKSDIPPEKKEEIIKNYLKTFYDDNKNKFDNALRIFEGIFEKEIKNIIKELEDLYQTNLDCAKIRIYMTTFPRCPYSYKEKWFMINIFENKDNQIMTVKHELNHFFFHKKFGVEEQEMGSENFHRIKEAFTIITLPNEEGYQNHYDLRINIKKWFKEGQPLNEIFELAKEYKK